MFQFTRCTPESVGVSSKAILATLEELTRHGIEMHSFMLLRHGKVCAEGWWAPYAPQTPHIMFSFSKSLTSTAIGFAVQEGLLSLDELLVDIFPDNLPENPSENLKKATVRHLLMMGCGQETEIEDIGFGDPQWISTFLSHPFVYEPGSHFLYNTAGTDMLSAVLKRKTGKDLTAFLRPRLTQPLGLSDIRCVTLSDGTEMGGAGYSLTTEDMARFVQFVANRGVWEGRQLLNAAWFDEATARQIDNAGPDPAANRLSDWAQGYGYQFWRCRPQNVYRGDGAFGQFGIVFPDQDAVLVATSASLCMQDALTVFWNTLLPGMKSEPLPEDKAAQHILQHRLQSLTLCPMLGMRNPGAEQSLNGAFYAPGTELPSFTDLIGGTGKFIPDGGKLLRLGFAFRSTDDTALLCEQDDGSYEIAVGMNGQFAVTDIGGVPYGANGRWRAKNKLEIELRNTRMAGGNRFIFRFEGEKLLLTADPTLPEDGGLVGKSLPELTFALCGGDAVTTKTRLYWEN